jgi:hypothetical protein
MLGQYDVVVKLYTCVWKMRGSNLGLVNGRADWDSFLLFSDPLGKFQEST